MVCFTPMKAYAGAQKSEAGKRPVIFSGTKAFGAVSLTQPLLYTLPCGGCLGCRMDRATAWAIRCTHEAKMNAFGEGGGSAFITLTISPDKLLCHNSVMKRSLQKFWKRLRKAIGVPIRYLDCGEYGDRRGRAHYHAVVFGFSFPDRKADAGKTRAGHQLYSSEVLSKAWPFGRAVIGNVTFQSARYVASYVTKKVGGENAEAHYTRVSPVDGEYYTVSPEFASMSLKPGIGESWFSKFHGDVYPSDFCIVDGERRKPPRYYDKLYLAKFGEDAFKALKLDRVKRALVLGDENRTPERMATREECATINHRRIERSVD